MNTAEKPDRHPPDLPNPTNPILRSEDVLRGAREAIILHAGDAYRLRVTSSNKLILTK